MHGRDDNQLIAAQIGDNSLCGVDDLAAADADDNIAVVFGDSIHKRG